MLAGCAVDEFQNPRYPVRAIDVGADGGYYALRHGRRLFAKTIVFSQFQGSVVSVRMMNQHSKLFAEGVSCVMAAIFGGVEQRRKLVGAYSDPLPSDGFGQRPCPDGHALSSQTRRNHLPSYR